jgi:phospholipid-translocating ATPase
VFIRTDQLDGETDWKLRVAVSSTQKLESEFALFTLGATVQGLVSSFATSTLGFVVVVVVEKPHKDIHSLVGKLVIYNDQGESSESLSVENALWMNTVLASGSALGLVIYTGADTRAVLNTSHPLTKVGLIDEELNQASKVGHMDLLK